MEGVLGVHQDVGIDIAVRNVDTSSLDVDIGVGE